MLKANRNFSYLFFGRLISNCGDSIYSLVISWYLLELTNNSVYVGLLYFLIFLPNLFSFLTGKIIAKRPKVTVLLFLECLQSASVLGIIFSVVLADKLSGFSLLLLFLFAFIASLASSNTYIAQDSLVPILVKQAELPAANMYLSVAYNGTDYLFNALGGILVSLFSTIPLLIFDLVTFAVSIVTFSRIDSNETIVTDEEEEEGHFTDGFKLLLKNPILRHLTIVGALMNFLFGGISVYQLLLVRTFGGATFYGIVLATSAVGTLVGSTLLAQSLLKKVFPGKLLALSTTLLSIGIVGAAFSTNELVFLVFWFVSSLWLGVLQMIQMPIIQSNLVHPKMAEGIGAFYTITVPLLSVGSLIWGIIAQFMSWQLFFFIFAGISLLLGFSYMRNTALVHFTFNEDGENH